jgi:hypothetical protein
MVQILIGATAFAITATIISVGASNLGDAFQSSAAHATSIILSTAADTVPGKAVLQSPVTHGSIADDTVAAGRM